MLLDIHKLNWDDDIPQQCVLSERSWHCVTRVPFLHLIGWTEHLRSHLQAATPAYSYTYQPTKLCDDLSWWLRTKIGEKVSSQDWLCFVKRTTEILGYCVNGCSYYKFKYYKVTGWEVLFILLLYFNLKPQDINVFLTLTFNTTNPRKVSKN